MITSDHNPMDVEHKKVEYQNAKYGTIGLESLFCTLNNLVDLETLTNSLTIQPKNRFGVTINKIEEGERAELTLFNPEAEYIFSEEDILSTSKNSIFMNKKVNGKVYGIYANKRLII